MLTQAVAFRVVVGGVLLARGHVLVLVEGAFEGFLFILPFEFIQFVLNYLF